MSNPADTLHSVKPAEFAAAVARKSTKVLGLVCFMALALPFLFGYGVAPLTNFAGEVMSAMGFALLFLVTMAYGRLDVTGPCLRVAWCALGLLLAASLVQYGWFGARNSSEWLTIAGYLVMAALAVWTGHAAHAGDRADAWVRAMAGSLLIGTTLAALASIAQYFQIDGSLLILSPSIDAGRTFGFIRQPNHQGTFLNLGIAALFTFCRFLPPRRALWLFCVVCPVLVFGIVSTSSRTALIQLIFLASLAALTMQQKPHQRWLAGLTVLLAMVTWGVLYMMSREGGAAFYGVQKVAQTSAEGMGVRMEMWLQTMGLIAERPWLGFGIPHYGAVFYLYGAAEKVGVVMTNSHNLFLQMAFAFGIPITTVFFAALAWIVWQARKQVTLVGGGFAYAVLGCIGIHAFFEFPLWYTYFLFPACFALGWLSANHRATKPASKTPPYLRWQNWVASACGLAAVSIIVWMNHDYYRLTPVYVAGFQSTLKARLEEANRVFWFRPYADYIQLLTKRQVNQTNYTEHLRQTMLSGCMSSEVWYQPNMIVALLHAGRTDEAKWILYSYWRLSGGKIDHYKTVVASSAAPGAEELLQYLKNPQPVKRATALFDSECLNARASH
jgi:hypothetical protein